MQLDAPASVSLAEPVTPAVAPVAARERLGALDTLRGVAVLGILLMNIITFALPFAASTNLHVGGGASGPNLAFWMVNQVLFEGKMRTIFSMLFGAGVILLTSRAEARGGVGVADVYYRRLLWLIAFGLLHAYLIWYGDILFFYGVFGLFLYPLRKAPAWTLVTAGCLLLGFTIPRAFAADAELHKLHDRAAAAEVDRQAGKRLSESQIEALGGWLERRKWIDPTPRQLEKEEEAHRGSYLQLFAYRAEIVVLAETLYLYAWGTFDVAAMMLVGMGLMKWGVFSGERSNRFYLLLALAGYGIGVPLNALVGRWIVAADFDPLRISALPEAAYQVGRLSVALGHVAVVMLLCKAHALPWLTRPLAAVGQTALTNYLLESVVCAVLFYGYGFGLYNRLERYQLLAVVLPLWLFQLLASTLWLRWFNFGPVEWLWRALTYGTWPTWRKTELGPA